MRHHAQHIPARTADPRDVVQRSVRIGFRRNLTGSRTVTKHDSPVAAQLVEGSIVAEVITLHVADMNGQYFPLTAGTGERGFRVLHPYLDRFADIFQAYIPHQ